MLAVAMLVTRNVSHRLKKSIIPGVDRIRSLNGIFALHMVLDSSSPDTHS